MRSLFAAIIGMTFALLLIASNGAFAATTIEKLMMPAPLSQAHEKQEQDCANCHKVLQKAAQSSLCIGCHKDVAGDLEKKSGFHGKNVMVSKSECYMCHSEHKGRDQQLIQFEQSIFDHSETNYPLVGGHRDVECASCHKPGKKHREAPRTCIDCHGEKQPHKDNLGKECQTCHSVESWKKVAVYDHEKTRFPLRGAHAKQQCISCHAGEIYKDLSGACNDCHAIQDIHGRKFGVKCDDCHSEQNWKETKFDHGKKTRFALEGAHSKAQCADCHGGNVSTKISMECYSCHKEQDVHKTRLGQSCGDCHNAVAWLNNVRFDHGLTTYPLIGQHVTTVCEACHEDKTFKGTPTACNTCHAKDDKHEGRFTQNCTNCHSPLGWKRIAFDHGRDAHYPLEGGHASVGCYGCHQAKNVTSARLATDCYSCHKANDVHHGAFGTDCARCHSVQTFRNATIRQ